MSVIESRRDGMESISIVPSEETSKIDNHVTRKTPDN